METHEELRYRVWLLAIGAYRRYECVDRVERMKIVEILEVEFARAKASGEPLEKERAFLAKHGIVISDIPVQVETPSSPEEEHNVDLVQGKWECRMMTNPLLARKCMKKHQKTPKTRSSRNSPRRFAKISTPGTRPAHGRGGDTVGSRVPPAIEEAVRERFAEGWSKSTLAREFHLNRRTVIRICAAKEELESLAQAEKAEIC